MKKHIIDTILIAVAYIAFIALIITIEGHKNGKNGQVGTVERVVSSKAVERADEDKEKAGTLNPIFRTEGLEKW